MHTQILPDKKPLIFTIHARPILIKMNALTHYGLDTTLLRKAIAKRFNVKGILHNLTVTSALSKSDKIDSGFV